MDLKKCGICNKGIPFEKVVELLKPHDFLFTCEEHQQYSTVINHEMVQLELGMINELPERYKECSICNCELSKQEISTLENSDFIITCDKHREVRKNFQLGLSKLWFEFKKEYPNAVNNNKEDWNLFADWNKTRL
ncbi:MAG: hypothetical protein V4547_17985 [Bacteroidota bacterium]